MTSVAATPQPTSRARLATAATAPAATLLRHALLIALLSAGTAASAQIVIDDFTDSTPQSAQPNTEVAADVVGGFRDIRSNNADNTASANAGRFSCVGTANFQGCTVQYDGFDMDPTNFTPGGFFPTDFTAGGQTRIEVPVFVSAGKCNFLLTICDDDAPDPQCESVSVNNSNVVNGTTLEIDYADLDAELDLTQVTALLFNLTPVEVPVNCALGPLSTGPVATIFEDGFESGNTAAWSATAP